jgi:hypothetical protein
MSRPAKMLLKEILESADWATRLEQLPASEAKKRVGPLMSFLPAGDALAGRAAVALGMSAARLALHAPEEARALMRRFLWHMNEESGNLGWGIPESMAESMARSPLLAGEFQKILFSYVRNTGGEDNYVEHAPLRRSCYLAIGRLLQGRPEIRDAAAPLLCAGLRDEDLPCRGAAAWALAQTKAPEEALPALEETAADAESARTCVRIFDGCGMREHTVAELARLAVKAGKSKGEDAVAPDDAP